MLERDRPRRAQSLARKLTLALVGLTLVLALVAALGVSRMFDSRQDYEDSLATTYELESAGSALYAGGVVEQAALAGRSRGAAAVRARARSTYARAAARARRLAAGDPASVGLVRSAVTGQAMVRRLAARLAQRPTASARARLSAALRAGSEADAALRTRQRARRTDARRDTRSQTWTAALLAGGAGLLALVGAMGLVTSLTASIRRPLDELVSASRRLAAGDLGQRVEPAGPTELRELHAAFNEMADGLERSQRLVEEERAALAVVIESIGDALVVCDAEGVVVSANPRAAQLVPALALGTRAVAAGSPLPALARGLEGDVEVQVGDRTLSVTAGRLTFPHRDGQGGVVWTLRDISERARLETMKTDFVASASHELRSPLTSIKGFAELLGRSASLGPRERELVDVVLQSTDRLVELVNDLLDVTRLEAGRMELHLESLDVEQAVADVATRVESRLTAKGQRLVLDLAPSLPRVRADPLRLRQILTNLIVAAHAATGEGGRIAVAGDGGRDTVELSVSDDGRGMTQTDLDAVFQRFVRRDDSPAGTGLGLWLVRSLVELQGGSVDCRSKVGEGTVFTVALPVAD